MYRYLMCHCKRVNSHAKAVHLLQISFEDVSLFTERHRISVCQLILTDTGIFFNVTFLWHREKLMDWRNDESDHSSVENFAWDEKNLLTKTKSDVSLSGALGCNVCSQGVQANFGNCKESRSFTSALERLELEAEIESRKDTIPLRRTSDAQTEPSDEIEQELFGLNARDVLPCRQALHHSDILNFQGTRHSPEDIARYWKKDSRMWLWKSVRLMRRRNKSNSSNNVGAINNKNEEEQ